MEGDQYLRAHINKLLYSYALTHLARDHHQYTRDAVVNV